MRVALAQLNTVVGDVDGNAERVRAAIEEGERAGADVTVVPELALTGYPPEDLLLRPQFARDSQRALERVAPAVHRGVAVIGFAEWDRECFNSAAVVAAGEVQAIYRKRFLPNYGVFDEARYFQAGTETLVVEANGARLAMAVCEDVWYPTAASLDLVAARPDLVCVASASPYFHGKGGRREAMLATRAADAGAALAFCNQVGGQDELVFDGRSAVFDATGTLVGRAAEFEEELLVVDVEPAAAERRRLREPLVRRLPGDGPAPARALDARPPAPAPAPAPRIAETLGPEAEVWQALRVGLRD